MTSGINGNCFLVTGASSGIGRATAGCLAAAGGRVLAVGRSRERLEDTLANLPGRGHAALVCDLAAVDADKWLKQVTEDLSRDIVGLAHCAGVHQFQPAKFMKNDDVAEMMRTNFTSALALAKGYMRAGRCRKPGSLVFVSSVASHFGNGGLATYGASKAALEACARALAVEFAPMGVRVNCVVPGHIETPMGLRVRDLIPEQEYEALRKRHLLGFGKTENVATAIKFLLGDDAAWMTGTSLFVDGGYSAH